MDKETIFRLLKSVLLTFLVSTSISYFLIFLGFSFLPSFILLTVIQFLFFYFYGEYANKKRAESFIKLQEKIVESNSKQTTTVVCPCDRRIQTTIPIDINSENKYICQGCDKQISVFIETKTALSTEPATSNPLNSPILLEQLENIINKNDLRRS